MQCKLWAQVNFLKTPESHCLPPPNLVVVFLPVGVIHYCLLKTLCAYKHTNRGSRSSRTKKNLPEPAYSFPLNCCSCNSHDIERFERSLNSALPSTLLPSSIEVLLFKYCCSLNILFVEYHYPTRSFGIKAIGGPKWGCVLKVAR